MKLDWSVVNRELTDKFIGFLKINKIYQQYLNYYSINDENIIAYLLEKKVSASNYIDKELDFFLKRSGCGEMYRQVWLRNVEFYCRKTFFYHGFIRFIKNEGLYLSYLKHSPYRKRTAYEYTKLLYYTNVYDWLPNLVGRDACPVETQRKWADYAYKTFYVNLDIKYANGT